MHLPGRFVAIGSASAAMPLTVRALSAPPAITAQSETMRRRVVIQIRDDPSSADRNRIVYVT